MNMTDIAKKVKNTEQDVEAKTKTEKDHAEGKSSSELLHELLSSSEGLFILFSFVVYYAA